MLLGSFSNAVYELVVHVGGLYAGGVKGLKHTVKLLPKNTRLIIVTVGLADVLDKENTENIKRSIKKQIPSEIYNNSAIFHLRGGIDYDKLNFKHRAMMKLLYQSVKRKPAEEIKAEDRVFIETYNKQVDFTDFDALNPIVKAMK